MRRLAALPVLAAFAVAISGCPSPKPVAPEKPEPPANPSPSASPGKPSLPADLFTGAWSVTDAQGEAFDLIIFPNGQAVSTRAKSPAGARGERGLWRSDAKSITIFFDNGWTDRLSSEGQGFFYEGFAPGLPLSSKPTNQSPASRVDPERAGFAGVWRLNQEPDGSYLYAILQSSGRAFGSVNPEGTWKVTPEGALCSWPDGWNDLISRTPDGFQKRAWVGTEQNATPPDLSPAVRIGESRFLSDP